MRTAHWSRLAIVLAAVLLSTGLRPVCAAERPSFSMDAPGNATYGQHIVALWEKTKPALREDLAANLPDAEYLRLGKTMRAAWVNLQVHGSLHHADKRGSGVADTRDDTLADLVGKIIELVDDVYGWPPDTPREREDKRQAMRKSRLEYKIKRFDAVLRSANVN